MKTLADLYADLSYQELSNLAMGMEGSGVIREEDRPKVVGYANEGLIRLHSRFILKENEILIRLYSHITNYHLLKLYAESYREPEAEGYPYILDLMGEPFEEDVIKILQVKGSYGERLPLNDAEHPMSVYTPKFDLLQVPHPTTGRILSVIYQARHPVLMVNDPEQIDDTPIILPDVLYGCLKAYIAYKVFSHINTQESTAKAQEHLQMYESICAEAVDRDLVNTSISTTNTSFERRGFV